jgi:hypothetical protein
MAKGPNHRGEVIGYEGSSDVCASFLPGIFRPVYKIHEEENQAGGNNSMPGIYWYRSRE